LQWLDEYFKSVLCCDLTLVAGRVGCRSIELSVTQLGNRLIFDHVPKTGGLAVSQALIAALPKGSVSAHLNPYDRQMPNSAFHGWLHLVGHFGMRFRERIPDFERRLTATAVREPVSSIVSSYTFWRFNNPRNASHWVAMAHDLSFSDFIRANAGDVWLFNLQSAFLGGDPVENAEVFARGALSPYQIIGTTDDLPSFLSEIFRHVAPDKVAIAGECLAAVDRNASLGSIEISQADIDFLREQQTYDETLYRLARSIAQSGRVSRELQFPSSR
jgi:hypothetical protein